MALAETLPALRRALSEGHVDPASHLLVALLRDLFDEGAPVGTAFVDRHIHTITAVLGQREGPAGRLSSCSATATFNAAFDLEKRYRGFVKSDADGLFAYQGGMWFRLSDDDDLFDGTEWISLTKAGVVHLMFLLTTGAVPQREALLEMSEAD